MNPFIQSPEATQLALEATKHARSHGAEAQSADEELERACIAISRRWRQRGQPPGESHITRMEFALKRKREAR